MCPRAATGRHSGGRCASAELAAMRAWPVETGTFLSETDVERVAKSAVLGGVARDQLFGAGADPVGQTIRVNNQPFTVIGVLAPKGQTPMGQIRTTSGSCPTRPRRSGSSASSMRPTSRCRWTARARPPR
ncbi:MAG: ABC transporter permease [Vicinamibacterales bacterium]